MTLGKKLELKVVDAYLISQRYGDNMPSWEEVRTLVPFLPPNFIELSPKDAVTALLRTKTERQSIEDGIAEVLAEGAL